MYSRNTGHIAPTTMCTSCTLIMLPMPRKENKTELSTLGHQLPQHASTKHSQQRKTENECEKSTIGTITTSPCHTCGFQLSRPNATMPAQYMHSTNHCYEPMTQIHLIKCLKEDKPIRKNTITVATVLGKIKSWTFKHPNDLFQTYSIIVFSTWNSCYSIKYISNTDVRYIYILKLGCPTARLSDHFAYGLRAWPPEEQRTEGVACVAQSGMCQHANRTTQRQL